MIDIVMATHNHLGSTIRTINSIYNYTENFKLTIVDDSTDLTPEWIKSLSDKVGNINLIHSEEPYLCGNQIINVGLKNTDSEFVAYMGNSTEVEPDWLPPLGRLMEQGKDVAIVQPKHLTEFGTVENAGIYFQEPMMHHQNYGQGERGTRWTHQREIQAAGFACVLFRKQAVYPLEEDYYIGFHGFDDVDSCLQLKEKGWKTYYCGYSNVIHYAYTTRGSPNSWDEKTWKDYDENRFRFLTRWCKWGEFKEEEA